MAFQTCPDGLFQSPWIRFAQWPFSHFQGTLYEVSIPVDKVRAGQCVNITHWRGGDGFQSPWIRFAPERSGSESEDAIQTFQSPWIRVARNMYIEECVSFRSLVAIPGDKVRAYHLCE